MEENKNELFVDGADSVEAVSPEVSVIDDALQQTNGQTELDVQQESKLIDSVFAEDLQEPENSFANETEIEDTLSNDTAPTETKVAVKTSIKRKKKNKSIVSPLLKKGNFFAKNKFVFLAFAVPFVLMIYSFALSKFYPFGDNQIMVIDMWHQYFQFFRVLHEKLQSFGSLLYTWQGGLGTNFIALISYYAASPLYFLTVFVPEKFLTEAMAMIVVLKISFSGAFMCIYLRSLYKKCNFGTATFAILYALSAFAMGYYWCLMWLDVMALLPLCMLGMNKLIDEGKFKLYVISLALMLISNYYIGIMMCIFIVVYYPVVYFSRPKARGTKYFAVTTVRMAFFSALAGCIAAIILIPTYFSMQNTYYIEPSFPTVDNFYNPILDVVSNMLPNVALTVRGGLPNIYCGLVSFMMAILFLLCKKIPARQKVLNCTILGFLILSFNWNKLDYIWHCLHFPNELPYRYSFAFSFIIVTMAYQAFLHLDDIAPSHIGGVAAGGFIYLILAQKLYSETYDYKVIYISLGLLFAYSIILAIHKTGKYTEALTGVLLFIVVFGEMTNYTITSVHAVGNSNRTTYFTNYKDVTALVDTIEKQDTDFYRVELAKGWTTNDPALYGYRGVSQFSSELNAKVTALMKSIGLAGDPGSNRFGYLLSTPVVNSMLNIKYIIGRNQTVNDFSLGSSPIYTSNGSTLYKNKYSLSIGYMANDDIIDWATEFTNPFDVQNQYVWYASGISTPVFEELDFSPFVTGSNVSLGSYSSGTMSVTNTDSSSTSNVQLKYTATKTQPVYAYVTANGASSIKATVDGANSVSFENNRGSANALGTVQAGQTVTVEISFEQGKSGNITSFVYGLDEEVWDRAYNVLNSEKLKVEEFSDTHIKGTINSNHDGVFMTSIPYEKGWSIYVDGEKVETFGIKDAFLACNLSTGSHEIVMKYSPYGFNAALALSITSLIGLFVIDYLLKKRKEKKPDSILVMVPNDKGLFDEVSLPNSADSVAPENSEALPEMFTIEQDAAELPNAPEDDNSVIDLADPPTAEQTVEAEPIAEAPATEDDAVSNEAESNESADDDIII